MIFTGIDTSAQEKKLFGARIYILAAMQQSSAPVVILGAEWTPAELLAAFDKGLLSEDEVEVLNIRYNTMLQGFSRVPI